MRKLSLLPYSYRLVLCVVVGSKFGQQFKFGLMIEFHNNG